MASATTSGPIHGGNVALLSVSASATAAPGTYVLLVGIGYDVTVVKLSLTQ